VYLATIDSKFSDVTAPYLFLIRKDAVTYSETKNRTEIVFNLPAKWMPLNLRLMVWTPSSVGVKSI